MYSTNQAGTSTSTASEITVDISDIDAVEFRTTDGGLTVEAPPELVAATAADIKVTVTAKMDDNVANLDSPFSVVRLYATVLVDGVNQLRQVGMVLAGAAETALTDPSGRNWIFKTTLDLDVLWAAVEDTVGEEGTYTGSIIAFGVVDDGLVVVNVSTALNIANRD